MLLVFSIGNGAGIFGLLQVDELLAYSWRNHWLARNWMFRTAGLPTITQSHHATRSTQSPPGA